MSVNFYRESFLSDMNRQYVEMCKAGDWMKFLSLEQSADGKVPPDAIVHSLASSRPGSRAILEKVEVLSKERWVGCAPWGLKVVDIGCALAEIDKALIKHGHLVTSVDCCPVMMLKSELPVVFAFAEYLPFPDESFDVVIMQEVLEHVMDLDKSLREARRVLKPEGHFYFQVPFGIESDHFAHVRIFDEARMLNVLEGVGFQVEGVELIKYLDFMHNKNIFAYGRR